uniref:Chromophore lyase CpcS/CpeS homolog n=1 Tax=Compsopogon caeruleus TaxID=31354 RepID=A0A1Z1XAX8_9RHOD|nr:hypothetical protein [Compsopogon caeruleus]ARX96021.1 hypothetical protein [Compsopogon caeruleus]
MMNIKDFFKLSEGSWICQKTFYNLSNYKYTSFKDTICIKKLESINHLLNIEQNIIGESLIYEYQWKNFKKEPIIIIWNKNSLYSYQKNNGNLVKAKQFIISSNRINILLEQNNLKIEESIFFPTANLRLSTTIVKNQLECLFISFSSEIKLN